MKQVYPQHLVLFECLQVSLHCSTNSLLLNITCMPRHIWTSSSIQVHRAQTSPALLATTSICYYCYMLSAMNLPNWMKLISTSLSSIYLGSWVKSCMHARIH